MQRLRCEEETKPAPRAPVATADDGPASVAPGWQRVRGKGITFDVPDDWTNKLPEVNLSREGDGYFCEPPQKGLGTGIYLFAFGTKGHFGTLKQWANESAANDKDLRGIQMVKTHAGDAVRIESGTGCHDGRCTKIVEFAFQKGHTVFRFAFVVDDVPGMPTECAQIVDSVTFSN